MKDGGAAPRALRWNHPLPRTQPLCRRPRSTLQLRLRRGLHSPVPTALSQDPELTGLPSPDQESSTVCGSGRTPSLAAHPLPRSVFLSLNWHDILLTSPFPQVTPVRTPAPRLSCTGLSRRQGDRVARLGPHGAGDGTRSHQPPFLSCPGHLLSPTERLACGSPVGPGPFRQGLVRRRHALGNSLLIA